MHVDRHELPRRANRRRAALGMLSLAALMLHGAFLSELDWTWPQRETPHAQAVLVRTIEPVADEQPVSITDTPAPAAQPPIAPAVPTAAVRRVVAAKAPRAEPPVLLAVAPKPRVEPAPAAASPAPSQPAGEDVIPRYRTQMPATATLRYQVSRCLLYTSPSPRD